MGSSFMCFVVLLIRSHKFFDLTLSIRLFEMVALALTVCRNQLVQYSLELLHVSDTVYCLLPMPLLVDELQWCHKNIQCLMI